MPVIMGPLAKYHPPFGLASLHSFRMTGSDMQDLNTTPDLFDPYGVAAHFRNLID